MLYRNYLYRVKNIFYKKTRSDRIKADFLFNVVLRLVKYPVTLKRNKKHYIIQYIVTNVTLLHLLRLFFSKKYFFKFLPI